MRRVLSAASATACLLASPVLAAETSAPTTIPMNVASPMTTPTPAELEAVRIERAERIELAARMDAVIEASQKTVAGLQKMIESTTDASARRDLELRMSQVKRETTLDLMRVQATFAREKGRIAQAEKIEAELEEILNPKRVVPSVPTNVRTSVAPGGGAR